MPHPSVSLGALLCAASMVASARAEKAHFTYLWHLEQPIYWPDQNGGRYERAWQSIQRKDSGVLRGHVERRAVELRPERAPAGEGNDVFVAIGDAVPGAMRAAWWAKAGQAAQWKAFLADENDNTWSGWFDAATNVSTAWGARSATGANGGVLEGTVDLAALFGAMPGRISLAAVAYGNANAGALQFAQQVPVSVNGNGNLDAAEYAAVDLCALLGAWGPCS